jgi:hypothetical protein
MMIRESIHDIRILQAFYERLSGFRTWMTRNLDDEACMRRNYRENTGKKLDLENPRGFNEKILWLQLHDRNPRYTMMTDKCQAKTYVESKIGSEYVVPLIGVWDGVDEIPFDALPDEYVLKCNHDCGSVFIKRKGDPMDDRAIRRVKRKFGKALRRNYFYLARVWCYKGIHPKVFCEKLIETADGKPPRDYKIFCFDGEPRFAFVASDRGEHTKFDFFDTEWNRIPVKQHYPNSHHDLEKPLKWEKMLALARILSAGIPHVRVDFYLDRRDDIYFGELTFCHFGGSEKFEPDEFDYRFGEFLHLPQIDKGSFR